MLPTQISSKFWQLAVRLSQLQIRLVALDVESAVTRNIARDHGDAVEVLRRHGAVRDHAALEEVSITCRVWKF